MDFFRFVSFVVQIGFMLAMAGQLKSCTLQMMNKAAVNSEEGIMSYSKFTRQLTR